MVEKSSEGMALADLKGKLIFANKTWCDMHNYKNLKDLLGKDIAIFHNKKQFRNEVIPFNEKVKKHGTFSGEVGHVTKEGNPFPTTMSSTILKDEQGNPYAIAGVARNIAERKKAETILQKHTLQLETLQRITAVLSTSLELDVVLQLILKQIAKAIPYDSASIFLIENNELKIAIVNGLSPDLIGQIFPMDEPLFKEINSTLKPMVISDPHSDPRFEGWGGTADIRSWMCTPLIVRDVMIGYLTLDSYQPNAYAAEQIELIQLFVAQAAQAINNARMYESVMKKTIELESFNKIVVNRELKMIELKKKINELLSELGKEAKYKIVE